MDERWKVNLSARAIVQNWDIPPEKRKEVVDFLIGVATGQIHTRLRSRLKAIDVLLKLPSIQIGCANLQIAQQEWSVKKTGGPQAMDIIGVAEARERGLDSSPDNGHTDTQ